MGSQPTQGQKATGVITLGFIILMITAIAIGVNYTPDRGIGQPEQSASISQR